MAAAAEKLVRDVPPGRTVRAKAKAKAKAKARTQPGRPAKNRRRKPVQGATRNVATSVVRPPKSFAWLNRILVLLGAGIVLIAATKAYITVQSFPVQRISVTGELEHTQAELVQDMVQASLAGGFLRADLQLIDDPAMARPRPGGEYIGSVSWAAHRARRSSNTAANASGQPTSRSSGFWFQLETCLRPGFLNDPGSFVRRMHVAGDCDEPGVQILLKSTLPDVYTTESI